MDGRGKESKGILPLPQAWYPYSVVKGVVEPMEAFSPIEVVKILLRPSNLVCLLFTCVSILVFWVVAMEDANTAFRWKWVNPS